MLDTASNGIRELLLVWVGELLLTKSDEVIILEVLLVLVGELLLSTSDEVITLEVLPLVLLEELLLLATMELLSHHWVVVLGATRLLRLILLRTRPLEEIAAVFVTWLLSAVLSLLKSNL